IITRADPSRRPARGSLAWRPGLLAAVLVDHQVSGAGGQYLQRLQKLDDRRSIVLGQGPERVRGGLRLPGVSQDCLTERRELAVMEKRRFIGPAPQLL